MPTTGGQGIDAWLVAYRGLAVPAELSKTDRTKLELAVRLIREVMFGGDGSDPQAV